MPNLVEVNYERTGQSTNTDALGMREMQARAYAQRDAQHLLIKAPPASGKSRALMFLALDKMHKRHTEIENNAHAGNTENLTAVTERKRKRKNR